MSRAAPGRKHGNYSPVSLDRESKWRYYPSAHKKKKKTLAQCNVRDSHTYTSAKKEKKTRKQMKQTENREHTFKLFKCQFND